MEAYYQELRQARVDGVKKIGIKIAIILVVAFLLPRILMLLFRRAAVGGDSGLVLSALRTFIKVAV